ncbi:MAG TPA: Gfo/Idh/MocA family oxidoreductase [Candidatus Dormibacteraeota bacterium]|nr:Gfo/Idh/MocA family oxidoreductase [Candidatus Dormibacteraeota bacterium]
MKPFGEIGAAVVGTGFIGVVHVEALRRLGVQVHGVVGSSHERAQARSRELNLPPAYESFEAMLADDRVDVVHVTSPNHLHHHHATAALRAGKHVVCEKPLAMSSSESADLLQTADRSGLVHAVNFNLRFYPICQHVHGLIRDREIGDVRLISGHYLQDWLLLDTDWNWRLEPELGGGLRAVADIGSHWMDLTSYLCGRRITEVIAGLATFITRRRDREMTTDDAATIMLRYEGDARGAFTVSQVSAGRKNSLAYEIDGATSSVAWNSERPDELFIGHRGRPSEVLLRDPAILNDEGRRATWLPGGHAEGFGDTFKALYAAVYAAVAQGKPGAGYPTFADGHDSMLVCDAVARSSRERRWIEVKR